MALKRISIVGLIVALGIAGFFLFVTNNIRGTRTHSQQVIDMPDSSSFDTAFGGIFAVPQIEDSLPHNKYKKIEDSFNNVKNIKELKNKGAHLNGFSNGGIGLYKIPNRIFSEVKLNPFAEIDLLSKKLIDSFNTKYPKPSLQQVNYISTVIDNKMNERLHFKTDSINKALAKDVSYFFALNGYELKDYNTKFYIQNGIYNLAYVKWDTIIKTKTDTIQRGHYEAKQIKVRYASDGKKILIPINKNTYNSLYFLLWTFSFITAALILYFFLGLPIHLLINISLGKAFTEKNIRLLNQISAVAVIISLLTITSPYIFRLIFWKIIPEEFKQESLLNRIVENLPVLFMAIVTFFISKAFKKGYKLQKEQDLTI